MDRQIKEIKGPVYDRWEYQEILLAKMAGGDLYANETRLKLRKLDMMLDVFRDKPLYPHKNKVK